MPPHPKPHSRGLLTCLTTCDPADDGKLCDPGQGSSTQPQQPCLSTKLTLLLHHVAFAKKVPLFDLILEA